MSHTKLLIAALALLTAVGAANTREYPAWLLSQMPDTMHLLHGKKHFEDGFEKAAAEKWELASLYGNLASRVELGILYAEGRNRFGRGVGQDLVQALAWFELARMTKHTPWRIEAPLAEIRSAMTPDEIEASQGLLAELVVDHGPDAVESRILRWLRREKHKNWGMQSRLMIPGYGTITRDSFFRQLNRYVRDIYLPETEVILRDLRVIEE